MLKGINTAPGKKYSLIIAVGIITIGVGAVAISGWVLNLQVLTSGLPGYPTMKFNTAVGFILAGISLFFIRQKKDGTTKNITYLLSAMLVALGAVEFSEHLLNYNAHIDQLFVQDKYDLMGGLPGRMAAGTALCFTLSGLGLSGLASGRKKIQVFAQYCMHLVTLLATVAMLGYLFLVPAFYRFLMLDSMAFHTALTFFIFSLATTSVYPNLGLTELFTGPYTGNIMARNMFPRLVVATIALAFLRIEYDRHFPMSSELGVALFGTAVVLIGLLLLLQTGVLLNSMDKKRGQAEEAISALNKDLEQTIEKRTADLNASLEKLRQSEESFRMLVEGVSDHAIYMVDPNGRIMTWNKGAQRIKGYTAQEAIGQYIAIFYTPEEIEKGEPEYNLEVATEMGHFESEGWRVRKDGTRFWANVVLTPIYEEGVLRGFSKITRDITSKKKAEEISAREAALVQIIPFGIVYGSKKDNKITSMNRAAEELFGISLSDARGKKLDDIVTISVTGYSRNQVYQDLWEDKGFWHGEAVFTTMDGRRLTILATLKTMKNHLGEDSDWLGIYSDITALKATEERLELAFAGTSAGLWDWDIRKDKRWWSPRYFELLGYENNELPPSRETLKGLLHPDDSTPLFTAIQKNLSKPGRFEMEARYKTKAGAYKWFQAIGKTKFGENGEPLRMVGSIFDIDEKKKAQQLITEQAELIEMLPDGIIYGNMRNRILSLNKGAEALFEMTSEEARGKRLKDLISFSVLGNKELSRRELLDNGFVRAELEVTSRSGKKLTVLINAKLLADVNGAGSGWLCIYTDITPLRLNEELKKALDKLEANNQYLEQLAYISAHDIKAPIIALEGLADVLSQSDAIKQEYAGVMKMFVNKIQQMQRTNHGLNSILKLRKNLLTQDVLTDHLLPLKSILEETLATLKTEISAANSTIQIDLNGLEETKIPYVHFKSIFYNLLSNAIKYRSPERRLTVHLQIHRLNQDGYVFVVSDNGLGIDLQRNKDKLFGIFKRFHNHVEGTGIGLHITKSIVDAYGGQIDVESAVNKGTTFKITFDNLIIE